MPFLLELPWMKESVPNLANLRKIGCGIPDTRLTAETGLPVSIADDPLSSVVLGAGKMLSDFDLLKRVRWDNNLTGGM